MGNLRPFKLFSVALLKPLKYAYFIEKSTKYVEKVSILALDLAFYLKFGPRTYLGCPWLIYAFFNFLKDTLKQSWAGSRRVQRVPKKQA
jgi:hypothetical protein